LTPLINAITDPELGVDLLRLLHNSQEMDFLAPIRPRDSITSRGKVAAIESVAGGETLTIALDAHNQRSDEVNRTRFTVFIRGRRAAGASANEPESALGEEHGEPLFATAQTLDLDQTVRYAEASGDRNPIHVDPKIAAMAGLPSIIVHGLCTMAFAARAMVDGLCARDPTRIRRLVAHFARPVFPGDTITTAAWPSGEAEGLRCYRYVTSNPAGRAVIRDGTAHIAP
jgi:acyl dehydratase